MNLVLKRMCVAGVWLTSMSLMGLPAVLLGQDFYHGGLSAGTIARAGIYTPEGGNAIDALALNPAGLTSLGGGTANAILFGGLARGDFSDVTNVDSRMRMRPGFITYGALGGGLGHSRWSAGIGLTPDFLSSVNWHYADAPGTGGANYGLQAEKSEILAVRGAAGIAFKANRWLSMGVTAGSVYNQNTLIAPFIFQSNPALKGLKTLLDLHTRGFGWGGSFGLSLQPASRFTIDAAYSSPITIHSNGHASGNLGAQFAALGIPFEPDFSYRARVTVKLPQSVIASGRWQASRSLGVSLQGDFANYGSAFYSLPVNLTQGSNADINGFLHSSSIDDTIPLNWRDQFSVRAAIDRSLGEHYGLDCGFVHRGNLVPDGTVTPLTGAIMKNGVSGGLRYDRERLHLAAAYSFQFNQSANVGISDLLAGEYDHSRLTVGTQALVLEMTVRSRTR